MNNTNYIENLFSQLSEEVREFNDLFLDTCWKNINLNCDSFKTGITVNHSGCTLNQNTFIKSLLFHIPEWERLIGCKQHHTHDYCLDIHTLSVLKKIQENKNFNTLKKYDKLILLYAALLHDIEKNEYEVDHEHPLKGAKLSSSILYRLGFGESFINKVYILIKHHQILGLMVADRLHLQPKELLDMFKTSQLIDLQILLTIADIKSVKKQEAFYNSTFNDKFIKISSDLKEITE